MTVAQARHSPSAQGKAYAALAAKAREVKLLDSCASVLGWDQETMMPEGGVDLRSAQLAHLARLSHQAFASPEMGDLIAAARSECAALPEEHPDRVDVREIEIGRAHV